MRYDLVILWKKKDGLSDVFYIYPDEDNDLKPKLEILKEKYDGTEPLEDLKARTTATCVDFNTLDEVFQDFFVGQQAVAEAANTKNKYITLPNEKLLQKYYNKIPEFSIVSIMKFGD